MPIQFQPKIRIKWDRGNFQVKTISDGEELQKLLEFRYRVLKEEFGNELFPLNTGPDAFDLGADHLVVIDKRNDKIIGTYRIIVSTYQSAFYSQTEFNCPLMDYPEIKMELSRACVDRENRNGIAINLLWRGWLQYARLSGAKYVFGCASVKTVSLTMAQIVSRYLQEIGCTREFEAVPLKKYRMNWQPNFELSTDSVEKAKELVGPLLKLYFKLGAKVSPEPALDCEFGCIDFFIVLEVEQITPAFKRRYFESPLPETNGSDVDQGKRS